MKKMMILILASLLLVANSVYAMTVNYFYNNNCPYCQKAHVYLNKKADDFKKMGVEILRYDVEKEEAKKIYISIVKKHKDKINKPVVPLFYICDNYVIMGFDDNTPVHIDYVLKKMCNSKKGKE